MSQKDVDLKISKTIIWMTIIVSFLTSACQPVLTESAPTVSPPTLTPLPTEAFTQTVEPAPTVESTPTPLPLVPNFSHIVILIFENKEYGSVVGNPAMAYFNLLASSYTLLNQHYAITHPSLPNYISLIGGDTFGINRNCEDCFINAPSLPDLIEARGRTWVTYQEDMPSPCFIGSKVNYVMKHNPFIYFDSIRLDADRCARSILPFTRLQNDLEAGSLSNFIFITPNLCNSAHDCTLRVADDWLNTLLASLLPALDATAEPYLLILTWDEGQGNHSCCGLPAEAGGRVATILISPQVKNGFQDATPYSHYSLLKTISESWGLSYLGHAADELTALIIAPWK